MAYRQAVPGWRQRQISRRVIDERFAFAETMGNIMGLTDDQDPFATTATGPIEGDDDQAPLGGDARHQVGVNFLTAGRAVFTLSGLHDRFTYRINRKNSENARYPDPTYFVSVLTGGSNETAYTYMAILDVRNGSLKFTKGSKIQATAPAAKALAWAMARVWAGKGLPEPAAIYHEGRCGRCGRPLTVPESIVTGFGPDCAEKLGIGGGYAPPRE